MALNFSLAEGLLVSQEEFFFFFLQLVFQIANWCGSTAFKSFELDLWLLFYWTSVCNERTCIELCCSCNNLWFSFK